MTSQKSLAFLRMKMIKFLLCIFAFGLWVSSCEAIEFTVSQGDCLYRSKEKSFQTLKTKTPIKLKEDSILKAPYGVEGSFKFFAGTAKVNSELLFRITSDQIPEVMQGTITLDLKDEYKITTPSGQFKLQAGQYKLSIMEGFGVLDCISGEGVIETTREILKFKSLQKAVVA